MKRWVILLSILLAVAGTPAGVKAAPSSDVREDQLPLAQCTQDQGSLSVLFLMDTSSSLKKEDRGNERVDALQLAISVLAAQRAAEKVATGDDFPIYIDVLSFGTTTERTFAGRWDEWRELPAEGAELDQILSDVEDFKDLNQSEDTDYVSALEPFPIGTIRPAGDPSVGALELLERATPGSCRLLLWFTDGKLDFDESVTGRPKDVTWSDLPLRTSGDVLNLERAGAARLCDESPLASRLREGDIFSAGGAGAQLAVVALGDDSSRFKLIKRVAEDQSCGGLTPRGKLYPAQNVRDLLFGLQRAVAGGGVGLDAGDIATCRRGDECLSVDPGKFESFDYPFTLSPGISAFNLVTLEGDPGVTTYLVSPSGDKVAIGDLAGPATMANEAVVSSQQFKASSIIHLVRTELPDDPAKWVGTWRVRFVATNQASGAALNRAALYVFAGKMGVKLRNDGAKVRQGRTSRLVVELVSSGGVLVSRPDIMPMPTLSLTVGGKSVDVGEQHPDGTWEFDYAVADDAPLGMLDVVGALAIRVRLAPSLPEIELHSWTDLSAGTLEVASLPNYPLIDDEIRSFDELLSQKRGVASTSLTVAAAGDESAGCLEFVALEGPDGGPDGLAASVRVFDGETEVLPGTKCGVHLDSNEERDLRVEVTIDPKAVSEESTLQGALTFRSTSDLDPSLGDTYVKKFSARVVPDFEVDVDGRRAALLMLGALLLALVVLYALSFFGAQLTVGAGGIAEIPVLIRPGAIVRREADGSTSPLELRDDDIDIVGMPPAGRVRRTRLGRASVRAKMPRSPFGDVIGLAEVDASGFVVAKEGASKNGLRGLVGAALAKAWIFAAASPPVRTADSFEDLPGTLIMVVPSNSEDARRVVAESLGSIRDGITDGCQKHAVDMAAAGDSPRKEPADDNGDEGRLVSRIAGRLRRRSPDESVEAPPLQPPDLPF